MIFKTKRKLKKNKGDSLLEIVFYVAIFSLLSLVVIDSILAMTRSFKETAVFMDLRQSSNIMERMSREIKQAYKINSINTNGNNLILDTFEMVNGSPVDKTVEFILVGNNIELKENGVLVGSLNTPNVLVNNLSFTSISTAKGEAVSVTFGARSLRDGNNRVEDFSDTIVLRGKYTN